MDPNLAHQSLKTVIKQRNVLLGLCIILILTSFVLSLCVISKKERIMLIPAGLSREVEFIGSQVSVSYLEEMTAFFSTLLLELTPQNIEYKSKQLLKYVEPSAYHSLKKYFSEEMEKHKKYNLATNFTLLEIKVNPEEVCAEVRGVLGARFTEFGAEEQNVTYKISYRNSRGRLLITEFVRVT